MKLHTEVELEKKKAANQKDYQKRLGEFNKLGGGDTKKKPRNPGKPQQEYGCACETMRTYSGCVQSGTCKMCKDNLLLRNLFDPYCSMCACVWCIGVFYEKDLVGIALKVAQAKELGARARKLDVFQRSMTFLGDNMKSAFSEGMKNLIESNATLNYDNTMSVAASRLSRKVVHSKEELHDLQQRTHLSTKLNVSGVDLRTVLKNPICKGKRMHQNNLR